MKKFFLVTVLLSLFTAGAFAKSDLQLRSSLFYAFDENNISILPFSFGQYNFFGKKQMFGFGEVVDIGMFNLAADSSFGFLVGPAFGINIGKKQRTRFQMISGFNYANSHRDYTSQSSNVDSDITFVDSWTDQSFHWGNDFQFKFTTDRCCSFVIGSRFGFGVLHNEEVQTPSSSDSETTFTPQKKEAIFDSLSFGTYLAFALNF